MQLLIRLRFLSPRELTRSVFHVWQMDDLGACWIGSEVNGD